MTCAFSVCGEHLEQAESYSLIRLNRFHQMLIINSGGRLGRFTPSNPFTLPGDLRAAGVVLHR
jgi:hypothetical protein